MEPRDPKYRGEKVLEIDRISQELVLAGDKRADIYTNLTFCFHYHIMTACFLLVMKAWNF